MAVFSVIKRVNSSREAMTRSICAKKVGGYQLMENIFIMLQDARPAEAGDTAPRQRKKPLKPHL